MDFADFVSPSLSYAVGDNDLSCFLEYDCQCLKYDDDDEKSVIYAT